MMNEDTSLCSRPGLCISVGILLVLVGAVLGMYVPPLFSSNTVSTASPSSNAYQAGFAAARKLVESSSVGGFFRTPDDVRTLSGSVTMVSSDRLTLHVQSQNPFDDQTLMDRTVLISSSTTVMNLVPKDPKVYQDEVNKYVKAIQSGSLAKTTPPPSSSMQTDGNLASIKVGNTITVVATENVKTLKEFTAKEIQIQTQIQTQKPTGAK